MRGSGYALPAELPKDLRGYASIISAAIRSDPDPSSTARSPKAVAAKSVRSNEDNLQDDQPARP